MFQRTGAALAVVSIALAGSMGAALAQYSPYGGQAPVGAEYDQAPSYDPPPGYVRQDERYAQPQAYVPGNPYEAGQGGQIESHALPPPPGTYSNPPPPPATYGSQGAEPAYPGYSTGQPTYAVQEPPPVRQQPEPSHGFLPNPLDIFRPPASVGPEHEATVAALPPEERPETGPVKELPPRFRRTLVDYRTREPAGTIIIDTPNTYLYLVLGNGKAMRYGIGVGRDGFTWSGTERISRMAEWPDWHPPAEMIERQPYLPRFMAGGEGNPLGARALYLGKTLYRIHGTNQPSTIGTFVSSGCIRLTNEDIADLYTRVQVGSRVVVLPGGKPPATAAVAQQPEQATAGPYNPLAPHAR
jgi:lipoprotein-anchoring transpeptidase ErfK/SrfK